MAKYKQPVASEGECLLNALLAIGQRNEENNPAIDPNSGVYAFISQTPLTLLCDMVAKKLNEQGYRVTKLLKKRK